jgi:predicted nucleic acid-binding protein
LPSRNCSNLVGIETRYQLDGFLKAHDIWIEYTVQDAERERLLPRLFGKVVIPDAVQKELKHPTAPQVLREWSAAFPAWLEVTPVQATVEDAKLKSLGAGEREAITLAR